MKRKLLWILFALPCLFFQAPLRASTADCCCQDCCCECDCGQWYGLVGAGYAFSLKAGIDNPDPAFWDEANEGYNSDLGNSPFFFIGFGKSFCGWLNVDLTYSYYQPFHYQKYQTGASDTPGFTGNARTRYFDLDHQNLLLNFTLDPPSCLTFNLCNMIINPFIGAGVGVGINNLYNFHTVGFTSISPTIGVGSTSSIGEEVRRASFAWQGLAGLSFQFPCYSLRADIGYRYYDGGQFKGPTDVIGNNYRYQGTFSSGAAWKGELKANEITFDLVYNF